MTLIEMTQLLGTGLLGGLLAAVILLDLRVMRLPNKLAIVFVIVFVATVAWMLPLDVLAWRFGVAFGVLLVGMAANAARLLGGGDVKILSALALFIPSENLLSYAFVFCLCVIAGIIALLCVRKLWPNPDSAWRGLRPKERYPLGISIGLSGWVSMVLGLF